MKIEKEQLVEMMLAASASVFAIDLDNDRGKIIKIADDAIYDSIREIADESIPYSQIFARWVATEVHPDYREAVGEFAKLDVIREVLSVSCSYAFQCTRMVDGRFIDVLIVLMRVEPLGKTQSLREIVDQLKRQQLEVSTSTVCNYLKEFMRRGIIFKVNAYDLFTQEECKQECQYYFVNEADACRLYGAGTKDCARIKLNRTILEMRRQFAKVYHSLYSCDGDVITFGRSNRPHVWKFNPDGKLEPKE